jgi:hypothetical protein
VECRRKHQGEKKWGRDTHLARLNFGHDASIAQALVKISFRSQLAGARAMRDRGPDESARQGIMAGQRSTTAIQFLRLASLKRQKENQNAWYWLLCSLLSRTSSW